MTFAFLLEDEKILESFSAECLRLPPVDEIQSLSAGTDFDNALIEIIPGTVYVCSQSLVFMSAPSEVYSIRVTHKKTADLSVVKDNFPDNLPFLTANDWLVSLSVTELHLIGEKLPVKKVKADNVFASTILLIPQPVVFRTTPQSVDALDLLAEIYNNFYRPDIYDDLIANKVAEIKRKYLLPESATSGEQILLRIDGFFISPPHFFLTLSPASDVQPLFCTPGTLTVTPTRIFYQAFNQPVIAKEIAFSAATRLYARTYRLRPSAAEVFCGEESHYFVFESHTARSEFLSTVSPHISFILPTPHDLMCQWVTHQIDNFTYLMELNFLSGRSFKDLAQYPVMPWVIADYTSDDLDFASPHTFRDLTRPIGALNEELLARAKRRMAEMDGTPFLYGTHFSTAMFVQYFLTRSVIFCHHAPL
jgi:hypothetical protein